MTGQREERLALAALFVNQLSDSDVRSIAVHAAATGLAMQDALVTGILQANLEGRAWYAERLWAALDSLLPSPAWHLRKLIDQCEHVARTHHAEVFGSATLGGSDAVHGR